MLKTKKMYGDEKLNLQTKMSTFVFNKWINQNGI